MDLDGTVGLLHRRRLSYLRVLAFAALLNRTGLVVAMHRLLCLV